MAEILSLLIGALAVIAAIFAVPGFDLARWSAVFLGLASGQIYIAIAAFGLLLVVENRFKVVRTLPPTAYSILGLLGISILLVTLLSPTTTRTYSELAQLALYLMLFLLLTSYVRSGRRLMLVLKGAFLGALAAAILGQVALQLGWLALPDVYIGRGSNEGATFMSLVGVVSGTVLFVRTRNPLFLLACLLLVYTQVLATSRSAMVVSVAILAVGGFFVFRNALIRAGLVAGALVFAVQSLPMLAGLGEGQMNFSARERLALIEHGWYLSFERFWTGFGWGSTDSLAATAPTTRNVYPHFHNTYVQILAELGVLGWLVLLGFVVFMILTVRTAFLQIRQAAVSSLVVAGFLALLISANFDALLFGADRSVQVVYLLALISSAITLGTARVSAPIPVSGNDSGDMEALPGKLQQSDATGSL